MGLTILLALAGCALLFFGIWGVTVTMPTKLLAKNFPEDVQARLKPRLDNLPMSPRRALGWGILVLFCLAYAGLFVVAGIDGLRRDYSFWQLFIRFLVIGGAIKAFDIGALDYFLLTKTRFFQHIHDWIMAPTEVELYVSKNGRDYKLFRTLVVPDVDHHATTGGIYTLQVDDLGLKTRHVRVMVKNAGPLPAWHQAPGQPSYLFCDEMIWQ